MAPLKDKKKKKRPKKLVGKPFVGVHKTGMNRDIPMGGGGGSQNLLANLLASRQSQPGQVAQTPDQFKIAQDITSIKAEQQVQAEKARRANYGLTIPENELRKQLAAQKKAEESAAKMEKMKAEAGVKPKGLTEEQANAAATAMLKRTQDRAAAAAAGGAPSNLKEAVGAAPAKITIKRSAADAKKVAAMQAAMSSAPVAVAGTDMPADPGAEVSQPYSEDLFNRKGHKVEQGLHLAPPTVMAPEDADYSHSLIGKDEV